MISLSVETATEPGPTGCTAILVSILGARRICKSPPGEGLHDPTSRNWGCQRPGECWHHEFQPVTTAAPALTPKAEDVTLRFDPIVMHPRGLTRMEFVRSDFKGLARLIQNYSTPGRAQSIAFTALEEACRVAMRAIAEGNRE